MKLYHKFLTMKNAMWLGAVVFTQHKRERLTNELKWPQAKLIPNLHKRNSELKSSFITIKYNPIDHKLDIFYRNNYCRLRSKGFKYVKTVVTVYWGKQNRILGYY